MPALFHCIKNSVIVGMAIVGLSLLISVSAYDAFRRFRFHGSIIINGIGDGDVAYYCGVKMHKGREEMLV